MTGFVAGAFLALARKCELLDRKLSALEPELTEPERLRARALAHGHACNMRQEAIDAREYAETWEGIENPTPHQRRRWLRRYRWIAIRARHVEQGVLPFLRAYSGPRAIALTEFCEQLC